MPFHTALTTNISNASEWKNHPSKMIYGFEVLGNGWVLILEALAETKCYLNNIHYISYYLPIGNYRITSYQLERFKLKIQEKYARKIRKREFSCDSRVGINLYVEIDLGKLFP